MSHDIDVEAVQQAISHPVIDADGHMMEYYPLMLEIATELSDPSTAATALAPLTDQRWAPLRATPVDKRRGQAIFRGAWWAMPAANTRDQATSVLPGLLYERLGELGIDFQLAYPTYGMFCWVLRNPEHRQLLARTYNTYCAEVYAGYRDRLEPVAVVPMHTPEEAAREIEYAIEDLGLKAIVMTGCVPRQFDGADLPGAAWLDTVGYGSQYDYDLVWQTCERLGVSPAFHGIGMGWGSRTSPTNYMYNHLGHFAAANEATCRSLLMGGAPLRFPNLTWAFLEGGVSWACQLQLDMMEHFEKRNIDTLLATLDPRLVDHDLLNQLYQQYATGRMAGRERPFAGWSRSNSDPNEEYDDDFAESGIKSTADIVDIFGRFYFGCEADDRMNAVAFNTNLNPQGRTLQAMFASDIGHWDVPDARDCVPEAWELVEEGLISEDDFESFTFRHPVRFLLESNPSFFDGTAIADAVAGVKAAA